MGGGVVGEGGGGGGDVKIKFESVTLGIVLLIQQPCKRGWLVLQSD